MRRMAASAPRRAARIVARWNAAPTATPRPPPRATSMRSRVSPLRLRGRLRASAEADRGDAARAAAEAGGRRGGARPVVALVPTRKCRRWTSPSFDARAIGCALSQRHAAFGTGATAAGGHQPEAPSTPLVDDPAMRWSHVPRSSSPPTVVRPDARGGRRGGRRPPPPGESRARGRRRRAAGRRASGARWRRNARWSPAQAFGMAREANVGRPAGGGSQLQASASVRVIAGCAPNRERGVGPGVGEADGARCSARAVAAHHRPRRYAVAEPPPRVPRRLHPRRSQPIGVGDSRTTGGDGGACSSPSSTASRDLLEDVGPADASTLRRPRAR